MEKIVKFKKQISTFLLLPIFFFLLILTAGRPVFALPGEAEIIKGTADFVADRAELELMYWLLNRVADDICKNDSSEMFPNLCTIRNQFEMSIAITYESFKSAIEKDLEMLPAALIKDDAVLEFVEILKKSKDRTSLDFVAERLANSNKLIGGCRNDNEGKTSYCKFFVAGVLIDEGYKNYSVFENIQRFTDKIDVKLESLGENHEIYKNWTSFSLSANSSNNKFKEFDVRLKSNIRNLKEKIENIKTLKKGVQGKAGEKKYGREKELLNEFADMGLTFIDVVELVADYQKEFTGKTLSSDDKKEIYKVRHALTGIIQMLNERYTEGLQEIAALLELKGISRQTVKELETLISSYQNQDLEENLRNAIIPSLFGDYSKDIKNLIVIYSQLDEDKKDDFRRNEYLFKSISSLSSPESGVFKNCKNAKKTDFACGLYLTGLIVKKYEHWKQTEELKGKLKKQIDYEKIRKEVSETLRELGPQHHVYKNWNDLVGNSNKWEGVLHNLVTTYLKLDERLKAVSCNVDEDIGTTMTDEDCLKLKIKGYTKTLLHIVDATDELRRDLYLGAEKDDYENALKKIKVIIAVAQQIQSKDYEEALNEVFSLYKDNEKNLNSLPEKDSRVINAKLSVEKLAYHKNIKFYLPMMTQISSAETGDDVKKILDTYAAPMGMWRLKRQQNMISIGALVGASYGYEGLSEQGKFLDFQNENTGEVASIFAPIGLDLSFPCASKWGSYLCFGTGTKSTSGFFISLIDVGHYLEKRYSGEKESDVESVDDESAGKFDQVFSPGIFLRWGISKSPWVWGVGYSRVSKVRRAEYVGNESKDLNSYRLSIFFSTDIVIFPLKSW